MSVENSSAEKTVTSREWLALFGVMLGAFMAVLDIQITNSSLKDIAGAIGSSIDEGSWISTAYLVAEIIIIGMSGILAATFSIKRFLLFSAAGFLVFSVFCALCGNLQELIVCRALQGLTGGALIPLAFSTILVLLPKSKQSIGLALFGFTATFGPSIGPTIGGWLTDNYGWQWIFFVNIPPGIALIVIVWTCMKQDPMRLELIRDMDYFGIISMAVGLGSLEYVLEEGERKDWFGNVYIFRIRLDRRNLHHPFFHPGAHREKAVHQPRPFPAPQLCPLLRHPDPRSAWDSMAAFLSFRNIYRCVQGYSAGQIGLTLMWVGVPQLFILPFVPKLIKIVDIRLVIAGGRLLLRPELLHERLFGPRLRGDRSLSSATSCAPWANR